MTVARHPLSPLVDLCVYAPLGVALVIRDRLPELVESGRQMLQTQVRVARMVGELTVVFGRRALVKHFEQGVAAPPPVPLGVAAANGRPAGATARPARRASESSLGIPGYDSLAASQVVDRLASLSERELQSVRAYEEAGRHRRTILHRIEQLAG